MKLTRLTLVFDKCCIIYRSGYVPYMEVANRSACTNTAYDCCKWEHYWWSHGFVWSLLFPSSNFHSHKPVISSSCLFVHSCACVRVLVCMCYSPFYSKVGSPLNMYIDPPRCILKFPSPLCMYVSPPPSYSKVAPPPLLT